MEERQDFDERWIDLKLNLTEVEKIWFVLEYFDPKRRQMAHTIMSFEMSDGTRLACSIEVRRERERGIIQSKAYSDNTN